VASLLAANSVHAAAPPSTPAPSGTWAPGTRWRVTITDGPRRPVQFVTFRVDSDAAHSCMGGDWKRLRRVDGYYDNLSEPAWRIEGNHLIILLASDICDNYDQLDGSIAQGRFSARHSAFGIEGGEELGTAVAVPVK